MGLMLADLLPRREPKLLLMPLVQPAQLFSFSRSAMDDPLRVEDPAGRDDRNGDGDGDKPMRLRLT
jgi:hypothetical protein